MRVRGKEVAVLIFSPFNRIFRRGLRLAEAGRFEEAVDAFEGAMARNRKDPRLLLQYGLALHGAGRSAEGAAALEEAAGMAPQKAAVPLFLGRIHLDEGRPDLAAEGFDRARRLDEGNGLVESYVALSRWDLGDRGEAVQALLARPFVHAIHFEARLLLRVEERFLDRPEKDDLFEPGFDDPGMRGLPFLRKWTERRRMRRADRWMERAARHGGKGDGEKELACLEEAFALRPLDEALRETLRRARRKRAKELARRLKKEGEDPEMLHEAGCLLVLSGDFEEGSAWLAHWRDAARSGKSRGADFFAMESGLNLLGQALLALGRAEEGAALFEELCALNTLDAYPRYLLGKALLRQKDRTGALRAFARALEREPAFARFRLRGLARLEGEEGVSGEEGAGG